MPTPADTTSLIESGRGTVDTLMNQAADQAALGADVGTRIQEQFGTWQGAADAVAIHGLLPLAMTLLILHHFYQCAAEDKPFSVRYILVRTGVVAGLLLSYGFLVGLITSVAGSHGDWADWSQLMTPIEKGWQKRWNMYDSGFYLEDLPNLLLWLVFFGIVAICALLALAASLLLSIAQGTLLAIILALGKTCIVVSLVPGVSLGKSWAKYLAMVSAWSSVAGVVHAIVLGNPKIAKWGHLAATSDVKYLLGLAALYLVFAAFTLAVPSITGSIFSGAGSQAPGVMGAIAMGMMGARNLSGRGDKALGRLREKLGMPRPADKRPGNGARPHKTHHRARGAASSRASGNARRGATAASAAGAAARPSVNAQPVEATAIPDGRPGADRFAQPTGASDTQRAAFRTRQRAALAQLPAPPAQNQAMTRRAQQHGATLRRAYPNQRFQPKRLTPRERALLGELDGSHGRFAGWERGAQGKQDFSEAANVADRRVQAAELGQARPAPAYANPASATSAGSPSPSAPGGASAVGRASAVASTSTHAAGAEVRPSEPSARTAVAGARPSSSSSASAPAAASSRGAPSAAGASPQPGASSAQVHSRVVPRGGASTSVSPAFAPSPAGDAAGPARQKRAPQPASSDDGAQPRRVHKLPPKGGR